MPTDVSSRYVNGVVIALSSAALLLTVVFASQGGLAVVAPSKIAAVAYLVLSAAPLLAAYWCGAAGLGYPLRAWLLPAQVKSRWLLQVALGLAAMMLLHYIAAAAGMVSAVVGWLLCGVGIALLLLQAAVHRHAPPRDGRRLPWTLILAAPAVGLLLVAATCPPGTLWSVEAWAYDVKSYHLQLPREWMQLGRMAGLEHNVYSFLPGLVESAYLQLTSMAGGVESAVYVCQLFHVSLAVFAAIAVGVACATFVGRAAAGVAGALLLSVPWVLVTGSLAYDEMAVLAFGAAALVMLFDTGSETWRGAIVIGVLSGCATLAKLTAGPMIAVPIWLMLVVRLNHARRWRRIPHWTIGLRGAVVAGLAGALTLTPYFLRNAADAGNPVFPFATEWLGAGYWTPELVQRWEDGHGVSWSEANRATALWRQWLGNVGYGAIGGFDTPVERQNIARFATEGGVPVLWLAVLAAGAMAMRHVETRRVVIAMGAMLVVQLAFWMLATHLQSRFLIPTLLPGAVILGVGLGRVEAGLETRRWWLMPTLAVLLTAALVSVAGRTLASQTLPAVTEDGQRTHVPLYVVIDSLAGADGFGHHPIDDLPPGSVVYLVADNSSLMYLDRPIVYHTPFDPNPLGAILAKTEGDPAATNAALRAMGLTHVWIGWSELDRLHATYGFHPLVTRPALETLIASGWREVAPQLYALPR